MMPERHADSGIQAAIEVVERMAAQGYSAATCQVLLARLDALPPTQPDAALVEATIQTMQRNLEMRLISAGSAYPADKAEAVRSELNEVSADLAALHQPQKESA